MDVTCTKKLGFIHVLHSILILSVFIILGTKLRPSVLPKDVFVLEIALLLIAVILDRSLYDLRVFREKNTRNDVQISVELEHKEDLIKDLEQVLVEVRFTN